MCDKTDTHETLISTTESASPVTEHKEATTAAAAAAQQATEAAVGAEAAAEQAAAAAQAAAEVEAAAAAQAKAAEEVPPVSPRSEEIFYKLYFVICISIYFFQKIFFHYISALLIKIDFWIKNSKIYNIVRYLIRNLIIFVREIIKKLYLFSLLIKKYSSN